MFQVVHELPGRLRLRSPQLRHNPALVEALAARLRASPGVLAAQVGPRTGSLLIHHDDAPGRAEALRAEFAAAPPIRPRAAGAVPDAAVERLTQALLGYIAERFLGAVAAALV